MLGGLLCDALTTLIQVFTFWVQDEILRPELGVQHFVLRVQQIEIVKYCNNNFCKCHPLPAITYKNDILLELLFNDGIQTKDKYQNIHYFSFPWTLNNDNVLTWCKWGIVKLHTAN